MQSAEATMVGSDNGKGNGVGDKRKAMRFPVELPVRYRLMREGEWRTGKTANVSRVGVSFEVDEPLEPNTLLEVSMELPLDLAPASSANVVCLTRIVRSAATPQTGTRSVAAAIVSYYFARRPGAKDS